MLMKPCDYCPKRNACPRYRTAQGFIGAGHFGVRTITITCRDYRSLYKPGDRLSITHEWDEEPCYGTYDEPAYDPADRMMFDAHGTFIKWMPGFKMLIRMDHKTSQGKTCIRIYPCRNRGSNNIAITRLDEPRRVVCDECGAASGHEMPDKWYCSYQDSMFGPGVCMAKRGR